MQKNTEKFISSALHLTEVGVKQRPQHECNYTEAEKNRKWAIALNTLTPETTH